MKQEAAFLSICLVFVWAAGANASPLVKLDFDDAPTLSTVNQGSLGGTQALSGYNGWGAKDSISPSAPTTFDSGTSWWSVFVATNPTATYGDYQLPELSAVTVALWVNPGHFLGWRNIFASEDTSGNAKLGAWFEGATLHFTAGATGNVDVANVFTIGEWTHVAVSYDSSEGSAKVYIDGVETAWAPGCAGWSGPIAAGTAGITIGTPPTGAYGFNGLLDNLFIYDTALTQEEVQNVMMTNTIGLLITYTISGNVGVDGVTMMGLPSEPITSGGGNYSDQVAYGWSGTVTPTKPLYEFDAKDRTYSNVTADQFNQDYTATPTCEGVDDYFLLVSDLNVDCYVDLLDLGMLADEWLTCTDPMDPSCESPWE